MEIIDFVLPFVIKAEAQQLVDLQITVKIIFLGHRIIVTQIQRYGSREETADRHRQTVFKLSQHTVVTGKIIETGIPAYVPVELECHGRVDRGTELAQFALVFVCSFSLFETVTAQVDIFVRAIHKCIREWSQVGRQCQFLMAAVCKALVQVVFHTKTEVDAERRKEPGQLVVRVLGKIAEHLRLECGIECVEPFVEGLITDVAVQTQYVVTDLIVP